LTKNPNYARITKQSTKKNANKPLLNPHKIETQNMSNNKKIETVLSLIEICENNLRSAKSLLAQMGYETSTIKGSITPLIANGKTEENGSEYVEGSFDGENMIGDNGQTYPVPQNYASKSQLVVGDRLKWILTKDNFGEIKEVYKLIQPVLRDRVVGKFIIDDNSYAIVVDGYPNPIKILKASATYAMKNLDMKISDEVAVYIPKTGNPTWGAFISVISNSNQKTPTKAADGRRIIYSETADPDDFDLSKGYF
jgi:hypothetical protein